MGEPLVTVMGTYDRACAAGDAPQGEGGAGRVGANVALDEPPRRFDGTEIRWSMGWTTRTDGWSIAISSLAT